MLKMRLEDEVKKLARSTGMYRDRKDVLEYLFCVVGNGYRWVDGQLVDPYPEDNVPFERNEYTDKMFETKNGIYPMSEDMTYLLNFPDDIKTDWLCGIFEMAIHVVNIPAETSKNKDIARKAIERCKGIAYGRDENLVKMLITTIFRDQGDEGLSIEEVKHAFDERGISSDTVSYRMGKLFMDHDLERGIDGSRFVLSSDFSNGKFTS